MEELLSKMEPFLQQAWTKAGLKDFTAIQKQAVPAVLDGKDIIAESPTGTGKTLAYLVPLLHRAKPEQKNLQTLILAPTRELVMQIQQEIQKFTEGSGMTGAALIGGADIRRQIEKLKKHPQIIVGTPGRVLELIQAKKLKMHEVKAIVVDEADQIVEMNLMKTVQEIIKTTLKDRQLLFFSATISAKVEQSGREIMKEPEVIRINRKDVPMGRVEHLYFVCERRDKSDVLRRVLKMGKMKAIAFVNDAKQLDELESKLKYKDIPLGVLQGEAWKTERETVLKNFREGKFPLLLTTDVAARGLDIPGVTHVIHFDLPQDVEQYIHRSGRTGRMGAEGTIISIITAHEQGIMKKFSDKLGIPIHKKALYMGEVVNERPKPAPRKKIIKK